MSEKMLFCLGDGKYESKGEGYQKNYRIFNKDVSQDRYSEVKTLLQDTIFNGLKLKITEWIKEEAMTEQEKIDHDEFYITKGYLKRRTYEEAWTIMWGEVTAENKKKLLELEDFDSKIFLEITGIVVTKDSEKDSRKAELLKKIAELKAEADKLIS